MRDGFDKRAWAIFATVFFVVVLILAGVFFYAAPYGEPEVKNDFGKIEPFEPQKK